MLIVDYDFPPEHHDELDWAPPARMKVHKNQLSAHSKHILQVNGCQVGGVEKLVPFLGVHTREGVDIKRLKFMVSVMKARVREVHAAYRFRCRPKLAQWMRQCYDERLQLKREGRHIDAEARKLVMNAIYGKLIQNLEGHHSTGVHTNVDSWIKALNGHRMKDIDAMGEGDSFLGFVHYVSPTPRLQTSPVHMGWRVLELSRLMMMKNHYLGVKKLWPSARLLSTDTDGATYQVFTEHNPLLDMARANSEEGRYPCYFDLTKDAKASELSFLSEDQVCLAHRRAGELGAYGLEYFPVWISEFIGLRAKLYSLSFSHPIKNRLDKQRAKGIPKKAVPSHSDYKMTMHALCEQRVSFHQLVSRRMLMGIEQVTKKALSPLNDKVYQIDYHSSRPLGHWRNRRSVQEFMQLVTAWISDNRIMELIMSFRPLD